METRYFLRDSCFGRNIGCTHKARHRLGWYEPGQGDRTAQPLHQYARVTNARLSGISQVLPLLNPRFWVWLRWVYGFCALGKRFLFVGLGQVQVHAQCMHRRTSWMQLLLSHVPAAEAMHFHAARHCLSGSLCGRHGPRGCRMGWAGQAAG